jgi:hypothetical protein
MMLVGPLEGVHPEAVLAAGYSVLLLLIALGIEHMARRAQDHAQAFEIGRFIYHRHLDAWECPTGAHLLPVAIEYEPRLARYRAPAATCNRCPLKERCTDSEQGRELTRTLDPWLQSEIGRFHRGLSLVLVTLALLVTLVGLIRNHADADVPVLMLALVLVLICAQHSIRGFLEPPTAALQAGDWPALR